MKQVRIYFKVELSHLSGLSLWYCPLLCLICKSHLNCLSSLFSFLLPKNISLSTPFFLPSNRGSTVPPPVCHFHLHSFVQPTPPPPGHCCTMQHLSQALIRWQAHCLPHSLECKLQEDFMPYSCCIPTKQHSAWNPVGAQWIFIKWMEWMTLWGNQGITAVYDIDILLMSVIRTLLISQFLYFWKILIMNLANYFLLWEYKLSLKAKVWSGKWKINCSCSHLNVLFTK